MTTKVAAVLLLDDHRQGLKEGHVEELPAPTRALLCLVHSAPAIAYQEHFADIPRPKVHAEKLTVSKGRTGNSLQCVNGTLLLK